jgi:hypothetical protein
MFATMIVDREDQDPRRAAPCQPMVALRELRARFDLRMVAEQVPGTDVHRELDVLRAAAVLRQGEQHRIELIDRIDVRVVPVADAGLGSSAGDHGVDDVADVTERLLVHQGANLALVEQLDLDIAIIVAGRLVFGEVDAHFERLRFAGVSVVGGRDGDDDSDRRPARRGFGTDKRILVIELFELTRCAGNRRGGRETLGEFHHIGEIVPQPLSVGRELIIQRCTGRDIRKSHNLILVWLVDLVAGDYGRMTGSNRTAGM